MIVGCCQSPQVSAVERCDHVGARVSAGGQPARLTGLLLWVDRRPGQDVKLLGVVVLPTHLHSPVLQPVQLKGTANQEMNVKHTFNQASVATDVFREYELTQ